MDSGPDAPTPLHRHARRLHDGLLRDRDPVVLGVAAVAFAALLARLLALGYRPAHFDEARVAYWSLRFAETDTFVYRHIIHGPLIQHVTAALFSVFGPSDWLARLPVAIVGGLLPLSALLFREHLRDEEIVLCSLVLAFNPVLLYYSRYMRSDVLVAAFMFTALGLFVRLYDTRKVRFLYGASFCIVLGVASKENAVLYILTWLGGGALLLDMALFRPRRAASGLSLVRDRLGYARTHYLDRYTIGRAVGHLLGAVLLFGALWLYLFATRGDAATYHPVSAAVIPDVTLREGLTNPFKFPSLVESTGRYWRREYFSWTNTAGAGEKGWIGKYEKFAPQFKTVLFTYAMPTMVFSVLGFLRERYHAVTGRNLVLFLAYGGFVSALAYPLAMDVFGPWIAVHVVVPLAIPAAVGLGGAYRLTLDSATDRNWIAVTIGLALFLVVAHQVAVPAYGAVYEDSTSQENKLVQFAQPQPEMREILSEVDLSSIAAKNEGADVLVYGESFVSKRESTVRLPSCMGGTWGTWSSAMPLPWYLHKADATTICARSVFDLNDMSNPPPVIVTKADQVSTVQEFYSGYGTSIYLHRTYGPKVAIMVDRDRISA